MQRRSIFLLFLLFFFAVSLAIAQTVPVQSVVELTRQGEVAALRAGVASGRWSGTPEADLAAAVLEEESPNALALFSQITANSASSKGQKAYAWFRIYGYQRLIGERKEMNRALTELHKTPEISAHFFADGLPEITQAKKFTVQIGAFGSKSNAERLAAKERAKGLTVCVVSLKRSSGTLYAVRVGAFESREKADHFAKKQYGKSARVVERD